jgi:hypothetical protein
MDMTRLRVSLAGVQGLFDLSSSSTTQACWSHKHQGFPNVKGPCDAWVEWVMCAVAKKSITTIVGVPCRGLLVILHESGFQSR